MLSQAALRAHCNYMAEEADGKGGVLIGDGTKNSATRRGHRPACPQSAAFEQARSSWSARWAALRDNMSIACSSDVVALAWATSASRLLRSSVVILLESS